MDECENEVDAGAITYKSIATWRDDADAAYSMIHDDMCGPALAGIHELAVPALEARGLTAAMGPFVDACESASLWDVVRDAEAKGNEIANHSYTHPTITAENAAVEVAQAREDMQAEVTNPVEFYIFPFDFWTDETLAAVGNSGHIGARAGNRDDNDGFDNPPLNDATPGNDLEVEFDVWPRTYSKYASYFPEDILSIHAWHAMNTGKWAVREFHSVVEFDEATASAIPFKVTNRDGLWTIPSHHDYPADGAERLANAAADVISVVKDDFRSDNVSDHESLGVVDPTDETAGTLQGRGTRITFKDAGEEVLADLIVGRRVPSRPGLRFVRVPGQKRVYAAQFEADISTAFEDWIETNLLDVERDQFQQITLNDYFIDERTLSVVRRGEFVLDKDGDIWTGNTVPDGKEVDTTQVNLLVGAVMTMKIAGVRPKPPGLSGNLRQAFEQGQISESDVRTLTTRGFYPTNEGGLLSNDGELLVRTNEGILYTLRFGEIVYGRGDAVAVGDETSDEEDAGSAENRYLFITAEFDESVLAEPDASDEDANAAWEERVREGQEKADLLAARFAGWYYVIDAGSYGRIHRPSEEFLKDIEADG